MKIEDLIQKELTDGREKEEETYNRNPHWWR